MPAESTPPALSATYRLQLNASFTLADARARLPYLHALGVSHLYCSPILTARPGSTHGYDVTDPTHVSRELGGDEAFVALADAAHALGMGVLLDIVPNHMGIGPDNPFWEDVLSHGHGSRYADWFDVDWRAPTRRLAGKVLLPVLADSLENVLRRGEIALIADEHGVRVHYVGHHFPIDPATIPPELEVARRDRSPSEVVSEWIGGNDGERRLRALLAAQHYELAFWRSAQRDLNYRRFFDVNDLICLRVERPDVFEATHARVLELVASGLVDGLRVDHIDGLLEPRRYLERLRAAVDARQPSRAHRDRFPILVEKIVGPTETLPRNWPVDGTTGYELMVTLEDLFIDPAGWARLDGAYRGRKSPGFRAVAVESKRRVLRSALNADVRRIAPMLAVVARRAGWPLRPIAAYAGAIVELVSVLPVYRTYIDAETIEPEQSDRAILIGAFAELRARDRADPEATEALERALLGRWRTGVEQELARSRLAFVLRWQQLTGPAAAKGVEDTALYVYAPLASRNEVGGDPALPVSTAVERLHALLADRASRFPRALNATNTHDTKRSADVRARLDVLSEHPAEWERRLRNWRRHHRVLRTIVAGRLAPSPTTDNFIYQALIGIWPIGRGPSRDGDEQDDAERLAALRVRLTAYIQKAVREAKVSTSWSDPDVGYERAIETFIAALLDRTASPGWVREIEQFATRLAPRGVWNSLGRIVVHLLAPGVPDIYRGDELWFQALVDPDNRRPVNWTMREEMLRRLRVVAPPSHSAPPAQLRDWLAEPGDGMLKLYVTTTLLHLRRERRTLMRDGAYLPLPAEGHRAEHLFAFARTHGEERAIVVVPRLTGGLGNGAPIGSVWGDTRLPLPGSALRHGMWRCALSGVFLGAANGSLAVAELLARLPVAVLVPDTGS